MVIPAAVARRQRRKRSADAAILIRRNRGRGPGARPLPTFFDGLLSGPLPSGARASDGLFLPDATIRVSKGLALSKAMRRRNRENDAVPQPSAAARPLDRRLPDRDLHRRRSTPELDSVELADESPSPRPHEDVETYPTILREYASTGFRGSNFRHDRHPAAAHRRLGARGRPQGDVEGANDSERYGELGPYWQRRG